MQNATGSPWGSPPRAPTDPYVQDYRIRFLQLRVRCTTTSCTRSRKSWPLANRAIRGRFVNMESKFRASVMFPSHGLVTRHPLSVFPSLRRVAAGQLPRVHRYYEGAMTSCRPSRRTSFPSLDGTTLHSCFAPASVECPNAGLELVARYLQPGCCRGDDRISYVLGEPQCVFALLLDPGRADPVRPLRRVGAAPTGTTMKAPAIGTFEAESHSFNTRCLRFAGRVTPTTTQDSLRLLAKLYRRGWLPSRAPTKGFSFSSPLH